MDKPTQISDSSSIPPPARVLIVLLGAIGDVLRALPLLGRIRRAWPSARISWAVEPKSKPILEGHPWLDEIIVYDRSRAPWSFVPFLSRIRRGEFDLVLDLNRHLKSGIVSIVSRAPTRIGFPRSNSKEMNYLFSTRTVPHQPVMRSKLLQYQAFADALGLPLAPIEFGLKASDAERERVSALLAGLPRPLLGVIVGSSWPSRFYFPESTAAAIVELLRPAEGSPALFPVLLGSGREEVAVADKVMEILGATPALNLAGKTSLRELVAILENCAAAFGPDSGPMHIAAAVRCPIVSLWGSTAPQRSAPWGYADFALVGEIPCHPCYLRQCPIGRQCMRRIDPAGVASAVRRAIASGRRESATIDKAKLTPGEAA